MWILNGRHAFAGVICLSALGVSTSQAQDLVTVPSEYESRDASSSNCVPLGLDCFGAGTSARHQQIYAATQFGGQSGDIETIAFRLDCNKQPFDVTGIDIEVRLPHTIVSPQAMSWTFADSVGADETLVLDEASLIGRQVSVGRNVKVGMKATITDGAVVPDNESISNNETYP